MRRVNELDHEMLFEPYELVTTNDQERDIEVNLTNINKVFEKWIRQYPEEYLWFYKRWKYSTQKNILLLSDGKAGHLKQSLAVSSLVRELGFRTQCEVVPVHFKNRAWSRACALAGFLIGPARASWFFSYALESETRRKIDSGVYDIVISAGSSVACVNLAVARRNDAKSITVMKPGILPLGLFDLVLMPEHDHPPARRNVLKILGSLNSVDAVSMKADFDKLLGVRPGLAGLKDARPVKIGLLIGGDSKNYKFTPETTVFLCEQIKKIADEKDGFIFVTTSRRTPPFVIDVIKSHFGAEPRCKLLVVATVDNPEGVVGAIFYLSDIVVVSGESISMVSEAAASGKYTIVYEPRRVFEKNKVRDFLNSLGAEKLIFLVKPNEVYPMIAEIVEKKPLHEALNTRGQVLEGLKKIL
jgi:mitochondrial fission protein ELM1